MCSLVVHISRRFVRSLNPYYYNAPWPFVSPRVGGIRKRGPDCHERNWWPGQDREFPELAPTFLNNQSPQLVENYLGVQKHGYKDANGNFVEVPEMKPELIVPPDLDTCELKPYVSFRTDATIEQLERAAQERMLAEAEETEKDEKAQKYIGDVWPPPKITPELLFDTFYAKKVLDHLKNEVESKHKGDGSS